MAITILLKFQTQLLYGWSVSILLLTIALIGPAKMGNINYKYNPYDAAIYAAFSPMSWCTIFAWIIFTTHIGHSSNSLFLLYSMKSTKIFLKIVLKKAQTILNNSKFVFSHFNFSYY